ncbi:MAG: urease accessory UreF family protein [Pseudomonadota bacterium]|nr:urease accessory UreF family protein [Pseudomonadota bacterium]MEC8995368.1 urease accessory UreF family protein [Pseudomonadota bacterium]MED6332580.1 urease accessory UreF family protein [Pseudomonadota bacterium]MEE3237587.1 urease accessory UreF family protein [Pseudomonadota bacterium]
MTNTPNSLLRLLQLVSPSSPVGAYAYSQGLEQAVEWGWIETEEQLQLWLSGVLRNSILSLDAPVLIRLYKAWEQKDLDQLLYWNQYLLSCRETKELREEEELLGRALTRVLITLDLIDLQTVQSISIKKPGSTGQNAISYCAAFTCAGTNWEIDLLSLLLGYCWAWSENQIMAALKLLPLGQSAGQRVLFALSETVLREIEPCFAVTDEEISGSLPGLVHASAAHESQYSRLFRS